MSKEKIVLTDIQLYWIKILYFIPLIVFGIMHFIVPSYFEFLVPKFVPGEIFWVYFSGVVLISTGAAIIVNIISKIACLCLMLFVLTFILTVDIPGVCFGEDKYQFITSLFKDISLLAGTSFFLHKK